MKVFVVLATVICAAVALPGYASYQQPQQQAYLVQPNQYQQIPILKSASTINPDGSYQYEYETGNGIAAAQNGYLKNAGVKDAEAQVAQGYFSYTGEDGVPVSLSYTADENGFQPTGSHLPVAPPLPAELAEAYAKAAEDYARAASNPALNDGDDGQYRGESQPQRSAYQQQQQPSYYQQQGTLRAVVG